MDIIKIVGIGILGVILTTILKSAKSELAVFSVIATGTVIILMIIYGLKDSIYAFDEVVEKTGISENIYKGILKIIGIGYLTEFGAGICEDFNMSSIAKKIELSGKVTIFLLSAPIINNLISIVEKLIEI